MFYGSPAWASYLVVFLENPDSCDIHSDLRFCLFPGDSDLPETDSDLRRLWQDVRTAIHESDEVVFIGYSLPSYDSFAVATLREVCAEKRVIVNDPSDQTRARFREIFPLASLNTDPFNATALAASQNTA